MKEVGSRSHRLTLAAFVLIAFAIAALIVMHNADVAERAERARLEARLDDLNKQIISLQAEMASAPPPAVPVPQLADAAVGDFPTPPKIKSQLKTDGPDTPRPTRGNDPGY